MLITELISIHRRPQSFYFPFGPIDASLAFVLAASLIVGCNSTETDTTKKTDPPAKVDKLPQEIEIARITLSPSAEARLGIELSPVVERSVARRRIFGGEVMVPAGKTTVVTSPVSGTIHLPTANMEPVRPGERIVAGAPIFTLVPLLSAERDVPTPAERMQMGNTVATLLAAQTVAEGDTARGRAEVEAAQIAVDRAKQLLSDGAGSARSVDDARAQLNIVTANLRTSEARVQQLAELLNQLNGASETETVVPMSLSAPQAGVVRNIFVEVGQAIATGTAVFEVVDTETMWVRVPVYVGLLDNVRADADANLVRLGAYIPRPDRNSSSVPSKPNGPTPVARPVNAPPSADPLNATSDLYYEVDNSDGRLHPGERIGVELMLQGDQDRRVVPATSVLYDIFGGTWIYARVGEHSYERRRVLVQFREGDEMILAQSPNVGVEVVRQGAAELFGVEFGAGK